MAIITTITELFKKILTIGTPKDDDVLYKKVIERKVPKQSAEALVVEDFKNVIQNAKSKILNATTQEEETKVNLETTSTKTKTVAKKKTTAATKPKKSTVKKKTTERKSTATAKKTTTKTTKASNKTPTTKKKTVAATKKTATSAPKKEAAKSKTTTVAKGAKKAAKIALYTKNIKKHYGKVDEDFLAIIVKNLGPSIYRKDAELVSCSDPKELDTVRKNFLMKKLGLEESKELLDIAIKEVCQELKGTRTKYRATFYYRLAQKFKKESVLS